jgi:class 3 adenylate cyclase
VRRRIRSDEGWRNWLRDVGEGWGTPEFFARYLREYSTSVCDDEEFRDWYVRHMRQSASPGAAVAFQRMVMEGDVSDVLSAVRVPTLVLHRAVSTESTEYVARRIRGATMKEIPGLEDGYSWADPERNELLLRETKAFLAGLDRGSEPDRILTTILFTDIVGSTERAATLGDEAWRALLARHHALIRRRLAEFRGDELNTTGDGFFASFDGPGRAVRCACAIRDGMKDLDLEIRAGIHTGEAQVMEGEIGGIAVHTAARIAAEAHPNEVLVSITVRDLVAGSGLEFHDRGEHTLKGIPGTPCLFAVG